MDVHLIDGTYELFRHYFAVPSRQSSTGVEIGAYRGVLGNVLTLLESGATHVAVATDHVIESFRNDLWPGYKDGSGVELELLVQFGPLEDGLRAMGVAVWPMVEHEADDGMAAGAAMAAADERVEQVLICTVDKDLAQCVGGKVVQWDRRKDVVLDTAGVREKFGVGPESIADYLGLVGDSADGFPGLPGWGAKSTSTVLDRYVHIEDIPLDVGDWDVTVRSGAKLAATLADQLDLALLFRRIATVEVDAPVSASVDDIEWRGPRPEFAQLCEEIDAAGLAERATRLAASRGLPC
jgi:5'-3' exonuclease